MVDSGPRANQPDGHDDHDPELIVALLDRDLPAEERAVAEARLVTCPACASLHEDLMALARATIAIEPASRPRDFTISATMAAELGRAAAGEPMPVGTRLTGEMPDSRSPHATHDRVLIANLVDRSPSDAERARGEEQLAACQDCALLYEDLVALRTATAAMPAPSRPRDFTLTLADAERLRVRGWRRLLAVIGSSRDVFSRPLAIGLTTLGLAGLLIATIPGSIPGLGGASTSLSTVGDAARNAAGGDTGSALSPESLAQGTAAPSAAAQTGPAMAATAPTPAASEGPLVAPAPSAAGTPPDVLFEGGESSPIAGEPDGRGPFDLYGTSLSERTSGPSSLVIAAAILLLSGLGLFGLRWTARRLGDG